MFALRPQQFAEFEKLKTENIINLGKAKEEGAGVVGMYCTYCPKEMVVAAGAVPITLCGTKEDPIPAAEQDLPRNLCPLIKSSYGFAVTDTCPFLHVSDFVVGETTCDGKKKMFELMAKIKPVHIMHLPQLADEESSLTLWREEMIKLQRVLEEKLGVEITPEKLREAIKLINAENAALKELYDLNHAKPALISGSDLLTVSWLLGFNRDKREGIEKLRKLVAEIKAMAAEGYHVGEKDSPRILITGTPMGLGCEKVITLVEECGGVVVSLENCTGYKTLELTIDESDPRDPYTLLAEKYLHIPCSVMYQNQRRLDLLSRMIKDFKVDGVIDLTWQACHTYNIESKAVSELVNQHGLPYLHLETDYSNSDKETLRVRIEAFLEMI